MGGGGLRPSQPVNSISHIKLGYSLKWSNIIEMGVTDQHGANTLPSTFIFQMFVAHRHIAHV